VLDLPNLIDSLYFPLSGMTGFFAVMADGRTVALAATGREGFLGVTALLAAEMPPLRAVVLIEGNALRFRLGELQRMLSANAQFTSGLHRHCKNYLAQIVQIGACHALHSLQQRVALWLLMARDRCDSDSLLITHEALSELLGCRRASVTEALSQLESAGLVRGGRGEISITDRVRLAEQACECYSYLR